MFMRVAIMSMLLIAELALNSAAMAHPGGLDRNGCHHNRKTGEYHCHRSK